MKRVQTKITIMISLDVFRRFLLSIYDDIPEIYIKDTTIFLERESKSLIHVRAIDKCTISETPEYTIISAKGVLDIFYRSKSGRTKLHWDLVQREDKIGKLTGTASSSTLIRLASAGIYNQKYDPKRNHKQTENHNSQTSNMQMLFDNKR